MENTDIFITFFIFSITPILAIGMIIIPIKILFKIFSK